MHRPEQQKHPVNETGVPANRWAATKTIVRRAAVLVDEDTITIKGPGIFETLRPARMRPIFVGTVGGWMLDRQHLPDALAVLDAAGYRVAVVEAGGSR